MTLGDGSHEGSTGAWLGCGMRTRAEWPSRLAHGDHEPFIGVSAFGGAMASDARLTVQ